MWGWRREVVCVEVVCEDVEVEEGGGIYIHVYVKRWRGCGGREGVM